MLPRYFTMIVALAAALVAALAPVAAVGAQAPAERMVVGVVVNGANRAPLGHSMVSLQPVARQTFSDDSGRFAFAHLPPGRYRLRITHLGFAPADRLLTVADDSTVTRVTVALDAVQVRLATVQVTADAPCTAPGAPTAAKDREFAVIFQQLVQNAQQYRLLADSFPYVYHEAHTNYTVRGDSVIESIRMDTVLLRSDKPFWTYRPGRVISTDFITRQRSMHLPTLSDLASPAFVKNHCFRFAGEERTADGTAVRIDFRAASALTSPDVNGSILLDANGYQIRRAELHLSRVPSALKRVKAIQVTTLFREVQPDVLVFSEVHAVSTMAPSKDLLDPIESIEDHALIDFGFLRADPRRGTQKP